jgi:hypothetical protein
METGSAKRRDRSERAPGVGFWVWVALVLHLVLIGEARWFGRQTQLASSVLGAMYPLGPPVWLETAKDVEQPSAPREQSAEVRPHPTHRSHVEPGEHVPTKSQPAASDPADQVESQMLGPATDILALDADGAVSRSRREAPRAQLPKTAPPPVNLSLLMRRGAARSDSSGTELAPGRLPDQDEGLGARYGVSEDGLPLIIGSAFGGERKGALRGVLCFIPPGTPALRDYSDCQSPQAVIYTNRLAVEPPSFTRGFPEVGERFEWFAWDFTGKFTVTQSGKHLFRIISDDGAVIWIDDKMVVDNDGLHRAIDRRGSVELKPGEHWIRVLYFHGGKYETLGECARAHARRCFPLRRNPVVLRLSVILPDGHERPFGPEL